MENLSIAIVSEDKAYGRALSASLLAVCRDLAIKIFDCRQFIREWYAFRDGGEYCDKFDLILWDGKEIEKSYSGNMVFLSAKASSAGKDFASKRFSLYKYSSGRSMIASIFEIYSFLTGRRAVYVHREKADLFAFASWEGGSGCTTAALAVARELCRFRGRKALLVSLEPVESAADFFICPSGLKSIGEYLYRLFGECSREETMPFIESYLMEDLYGVESFAPSRGKNPLPDLSCEEIRRFIASLIDCGRYDAVVMDVGNCLSEAGIAAMELAERICFITRNGRGTAREGLYLSHLVCCAGEETLDKSIRVRTMAGGHEADGGEGGNDRGNGEAESMINSQFRLRKCAAFSRGKPGQEMPEGGFGEDIRRLTEKLISL